MPTYISFSYGGITTSWANVLVTSQTTANLALMILIILSWSLVTYCTMTNIDRTPHNRKIDLVPYHTLSNVDAQINDTCHKV